MPIYIYGEYGHPAVKIGMHLSIQEFKNNKSYTWHTIQVTVQQYYKVGRLYM